ncbi:hypothetical protein Goshw_004102 [Gossypium schwendimanii]|uniref:Uncharacterized protein n=1 Tax=Gossypium schwendimanii TaxID=34291 RepID=A0A7J9MRF8_GOSSC|nr:hypothetical protein [Gossypium schwendimanii]
MEKTIAALVGTSIGRWLLLKMLYGTYILPVNADIVVSLIMTNLLPNMQKIEPLGNMLKQLQILLKK